MAGVAGTCASQPATITGCGAVGAAAPSAPPTSRSRPRGGPTPAARRTARRGRELVVGVEPARCSAAPTPAAADGSSCRPPPASRRPETTRQAPRPTIASTRGRTRATRTLRARRTRRQLVVGQLGGGAGRAVDDVGDAEPEPGSRPSSSGDSSRGVKPEPCSAGQKRLPGRAKWWPRSADSSDGLMPQNRTSRSGPRTSGSGFGPPRRQRPPRGGDRVGDAGGVDVEVRDGADRRRAERRHRHALRRQRAPGTPSASGTREDRRCSSRRASASIVTPGSPPGRRPARARSRGRRPGARRGGRARTGSPRRRSPPGASRRRASA